MHRTKLWADLAKSTALAGLLGVAMIPRANSAPVLFTWDPGATLPTGLPGGADFTANNIGVNDYANLTIDSGGVFNEDGVLTVSGFLAPGNPHVSVPGLNASPTGFNLYAVVAASGLETAPPPPLSGLSSDGVFTSATYTFYGSPTSGITVGNNTPGSTGMPTVSGQGTLIPLFSGTLSSGTSVLTAPTGGGYSATADLNLSIVTCGSSSQILPSGVTCAGNESGFFVNPLPAQLQLVVSNFSANTSVTSLTPGSPDILNIQGGGGNITFRVAAVPEPASLMVLGSSLIGLGIARRRRNRG